MALSDFQQGIITTIVAGFVGGLGAVFVGGLDFLNKDRELDIRMVNVGLSILRGEATGDKETLQARRFALRLLNKYAAVEIPKEEFDDWASKGVTPFKATNLFSSLANGEASLAYSYGKRNECAYETYGEYDRIARLAGTFIAEFEGLNTKQPLTEEQWFALCGRKNVP